MLIEQIDSDLKEAMKAREQVTIDALRMLKARITNEGISQQKEFDDAQLQAIIASEVKRRKDSIEAYESGNRPELAEKEKQEIAALMKYMPEQLSESEVDSIITAKLSGSTFTAADFGKAMALVMPELKGKADGQLVSKILKEKLNS